MDLRVEMDGKDVFVTVDHSKQIFPKHFKK